MISPHMTVAALGSLSSDEKAYLVRMINEVYREWEGFLLKEGVERMTLLELDALIHRGELICLYIEGDLKGCAQLSKKNETTYLFGLLCVDAGLKGQGHGRHLLDFIEDTALRGGAKTLQLELLEPANGQHAHKKFLREWYIRKGYQPTHQEDFPRKDILAMPATFTIFVKALG